MAAIIHAVVCFSLVVYAFGVDDAFGRREGSLKALEQISRTDNRIDQLETPEPWADDAIRKLNIARAFNPPLPINTCSPYNNATVRLYILYHGCNGKYAVDELQGCASASWNVYGVQMQPSFRRCYHSGENHLYLPSTMPVLLDPVYQAAFRENAASIVMGLDASQCSEKWIGVASWKSWNVKLDKAECHNLRSIMSSPSLDMDTIDDDNAALFWFGDHDKIPIPYNLDTWFNHLPKQYAMLKLFFDGELSVDVDTLIKNAHSTNATPMPLPFCNWFIASRPVMRTLAELQVILYIWLETNYPMYENQCDKRNFQNGGTGCFSFVASCCTTTEETHC